MAFWDKGSLKARGFQAAARGRRLRTSRKGEDQIFTVATAQSPISSRNSSFWRSARAAAHGKLGVQGRGAAQSDVPPA